MTLNELLDEMLIPGHIGLSTNYEFSFYQPRLIFVDEGALNEYILLTNKFDLLGLEVMGLNTTTYHGETILEVGLFGEIERDDAFLRATFGKWW